MLKIYVARLGKEQPPPFGTAPWQRLRAQQKVPHGLFCAETKGVIFWQENKPEENTTNGVCACFPRSPASAGCFRARQGRCLSERAPGPARREPKPRGPCRPAGPGPRGAGAPRPRSGGGGDRARAASGAMTKGGGVTTAGRPLGRGRRVAQPLSGGGGTGARRLRSLAARPVWLRPPAERCPRPPAGLARRAAALHLAEGR